VENLSTRAAPVVREIAARSAELAAKAGEAAGPPAPPGAGENTAGGGGARGPCGREDRSGRRALCGPKSRVRDRPSPRGDLGFATVGRPIAIGLGVRRTMASPLRLARLATLPQTR